jgi:type IV secretion system protein VirD4
MRKSKPFKGTALPFLGYESATTLRSVGFASQSAPTSRRRRPAFHSGNSHVLTIGATGSGKTNLLIANLLQYEGSVIVLDIRGDAVRATARFRREELGQPTYILDPFGVTGGQGDRLNPLDLAWLRNIDIESECQSIAAVLASGVRSAHDPYWHAAASDLLAADLAFVLTQKEPAKQSFDGLMEMLYADDPAYHHAVLADTVMRKCSFARAGVNAWLSLPEGNSGTRTCVLSTVHSMVNSFRSRAMMAAMASPSTVNLKDLLEGKPVSIYLALPIERMASHGVCLKLWLDLLLQVLMRRSSAPLIPTMVMIDEAAQIGPSPALKTVATYLRAHGVRLWTFWQDLSQLRATYPLDWETLVNNTSALTFMPGTGLAGRELAAIAGVSATAIGNLALDEQLVCETGMKPRVVRMACYWKDSRFRGRFEPIPRFASSTRKADAVGRGT